eukprot:4273235-Amphidinium_carterae.2
MIAWPELDLSAARIQDIIKHCPKTAGGPDGVTYKMLQGSDKFANILEAGALGMATGDSVPDE